MLTLPGTTVTGGGEAGTNGGCGSHDGHQFQGLKDPTALRCCNVLQSFIPRHVRCHSAREDIVERVHATKTEDREDVMARSVMPDAREHPSPYMQIEQGRALHGVLDGAA